MDKKIIGIISGLVIVIALIGASSITLNEEPVIKPEILPQQNEKIGLVINTPNQATSLQELDQVYSDASSTGIGRSNVYLFWNTIEPVKGEFDWEQSDILMSFSKKNNLKVTLFFSVINGETLGPFPKWIGKPPIQSISADKLVSVLDAILSRYDIIDTVILAGQSESQFRFHEQNIPVYKELFNVVYDQLKENHPDVRIGNEFALHTVLNKDLGHIVRDLTIGDFVAFSYSPVDNLHDIVKTPQEAKDDLYKTIELVQDTKIGFFEISWSTSDFVGGNSESQLAFIEKSFEFYSENSSEIEFFTWYRQYDKPENTCIVDEQEEQENSEDKFSVTGSGFGNSEFIIERLNHYICNSGLIENDGSFKPSWNEFKNQIEMIN